MVGDLALQGGLQQPVRQLLEQSALAGQLQALGLGPGDQFVDQPVIHSSRAGLPGPAGRPGWRLERAAIAVFSSMDGTTAPSGGSRYRSHTSATRSQK